jgi:selenium metabolism protein YedF
MIGKTLIVNSQSLGRGDDILGNQLMGSFLRKLWAADAKPARIIFYNSAVRLLAEGSPVLDALEGLHGAGVDLIACGTCVTYYDLASKIAVGRVSDMNEIVGALTTSEAVVTV